MRNYFSFKKFSLFEKLLWSASVIIVSASFLVSENFNYLTLIASLIGVTALIFIVKGNVLGQILIIIFSIIYGTISFQQKYYGEMITYVGMSAPIAGFSVYTWIKNPYGDTSQVRVGKLNKKTFIFLIILTISVTAVFYFILKYFNTNNLLFSTISIATSFSASALLLLRIDWYAIAYGANDIVLIILWTLSTIENISYLPMIICFFMFLINDLYGFYNWKKMKKLQNK